MANRVLYITAGILFLVASVFYGMKFFPEDAPPPPEELARLALEAPTAEEQELAASQLAAADPVALEHLRRVAEASKSPQVRAVCFRALGKALDFDSMDLFLAALDDESLQIRGQAAVAVMKMIGRNYAFRADAPEEERAPLVREMRACWKDMKDSPLMEATKQRIAEEQAKEK
ncbi:MAG: hypothetical protein HQ581_18590, partial [Planctomycetes bacterium]|nr:hypothetical protein [Planctomycetota bacterium]